MADTRMSIAKLDVSNYASWSVDMKYLLIDRGLWGAIDPDFLDDEEDKDEKAAAAEVARLDKRAKAFIGLYVMPHHHVTVENAWSAKDLWDTLEATYRPKGNAQKLRLRKELTNLELIGGEPMTKYICRAKTIWQELSAAGTEISESEVALNILAGLPNDYTTISTVLTHSAATKDLTIDTVTAALLEAEIASKLEIDREHGGSKAFMSLSGKRKSTGQVCWLCGKPGHLKRDCKLAKRKGDSAHLVLPW